MKVLFTQDIGVDRKFIDNELIDNNLIPDWSIADGLEVNNPDEVVCICTASMPLLKETLAKYKNLRIISMSFTGFDHVDKEYCIKNDIKVYNVPSYSTDSVAELAIGLAISLLRMIPLGDSEMRNGNWNENIQGFELANKTCGIIGTGAIGLRLAELLAVFKCNLKAWSRTKKDKFISLGGLYTDLDLIFKECDIVFITIALNDETENLISMKQLDKMKNTSYLINVARGPIINKIDLIHCLKNNQIGGVGLDVYDSEPLPEYDELRQMQKTVLTPHVAYRTEEALERKAKVTVENILNGLDGITKNKVL